MKYAIHLQLQSWQGQRIAFGILTFSDGSQRHLSNHNKQSRKKCRFEEIIQRWPGWEWDKCISIRSALWDWRGTKSVAQNAIEGCIGVCSNAPMKELLLVNYICRLISAFPCNILNHLRTISTLETYLAMIRIMVRSKLKHCLCYPPGTQPSGKVAFFIFSVLEAIFLEPQTKDSHLISR